ncbi:MAG: BREX-1 system adenine-specific DNA-methyltransferase PglX [Desulfitobacterium hafniense]|nr:BREX-1 system adenine-specific DNA-methyltransferase PglX [Desulfitobacterium hafniense]
MNKAAIREFSRNAYRELRKAIFKQAEKIDTTDFETESFTRLIDEAAYYYFSRFICLYYLKMNGHLPDYNIKTLESQVFLNPDKSSLVFLNSDLPGGFREIPELVMFLMPLESSCTNGILSNTIKNIPKEDWSKPEIIGWLYQCFLSDQKDEVFALVKKNQRVNKEKIPTATQLFTSEWVVRFLLENSLGQLWLERFPGNSLESKWKYYLKPVNQPTEVLKFLEELNGEERASHLNGEVPVSHLNILDPACGTGHMLVYAFEMLWDIYKSVGYPDEEISASILENNLFGLDIDDRAVELARFELMLKAYEKDGTVLDKRPRLNILAIRATDEILNLSEISLFIDSCLPSADDRKELKNILEIYKDAKNYGTLLKPDSINWGYWDQNLAQILENLRSVTCVSVQSLGQDLSELLNDLVNQTRLLTQSYDVVVTNPPYMGIKSMNEQLYRFLHLHYPTSRFDLFAAFIERGFDFLKPYGFNAMVTMQSWMFLATFQKLRCKLLRERTICCLTHMPNNVMGIAFGTSATVWRNFNIPGYKAKFIYVELKDVKEKEEPGEFPVLNSRYSEVCTDLFESLPRSPIAYWVNNKVREVFIQRIPLKKIAAPRQGLATADNARFVRFWFEVDPHKIGFHCPDKEVAMKSGYTWFPYNKGGTFRKWYGNNLYVVNWKDNGQEIRSYERSVIRNEKYYFQESITWSFINSTKFSVRFSPPGALFDVGGSSVFVSKENIYYLTGLLCSKLAYDFLKIINPTMNFQVGNIGDLPVIFPKCTKVKEKVEFLVRQNIQIVKDNWDSFESSPDFNLHPFIRFMDSSRALNNAYLNWEQYCKEQYNKLKDNELELEHIFQGIYELDSIEVTSEKGFEKDISVERAQLKKDVESFISFAVGVIFGRYSTRSQFKQPDIAKHSIIPLRSFSLVSCTELFIDFLREVFGSDGLEENLSFISSALGRLKDESSRDRVHRYFINEFYLSHYKTYFKKPIYWYLSSGEKRVYEVLLYVHKCNQNSWAVIIETLQQEIDFIIAKLECCKEELAFNMNTKQVEERSELVEQLQELQAFRAKLLSNEEGFNLDLDKGISENLKFFKELGLLGR